MCILDKEINKIKEYLLEKDINKIRKIKIELLKNTNDCNLDLENTDLINEYNYYTKLIKRLKKYIKLNEENIIILDIYTYKTKELVCLLKIIKLNHADIGIPIEIKLLTGSSNKSYMNCTCYEITTYSSLYIDSFRSSMSNKGYGKIILSNLDESISKINKILKKYNINEIKSIEGVVVADEHIIKQDDLKSLYKKYGFEIDKYNRLLKKV